MLSVRVLPRRGVAWRAALSTLEIMTVLVAAHTCAGGELPTVGWVAATTAVVLVAGIVVLRHRVPLWAAVPALVVTQLLLHGWMVTLAPASSGAHHDAHAGLTWQMLLAHLVGAVTTAVVWELRRRAVEIVLAWSEPGLVPVPALRRAAPRRGPALPLRRPLVVVPLRGPPVSSLAC